METLDRARLGVIALLVLGLGVAVFGYATGDDSLFELGVLAEFVFILVAGALTARQVADAGDA